VRYDQGGIEWSVIAHIRVSSRPEAPWSGPALPPLERQPQRGDFKDSSWESAGTRGDGDRPRRWSNGERVLAPLGDGWLYPAVVAETRGPQILVWFDSGTKKWLDDAEVRACDLTVGSRVFCRWMNGAVYYGGRIVEHNGEQIYIHYDDGDKEWNVMALCRIPATTSAAFFGNLQSFAQGRYGCLIWVVLIALGVVIYAWLFK
jgi:hypothetical protein